MKFGGEQTIADKANAAERARGKTTKGTAEKAKPGKWKITDVRLGDGGKSFAVKAKKDF